jgi:hypothetical protein
LFHQTPPRNAMLTYNLIAYLIYGIITYLITVRIGWICYQNGYHFIREEMQDEAIATSINKILLVCYYLTNLGYITLMIQYWEPVSDFRGLVESLSDKVALIVLGLGCLHLINMSAVYLMRKKKTVP